jgi:hypothetical protein
MIKQPSNWNEVQEFTESAKLPLDAYVCKVKRAEVQGEQLCIAFDIAEGAQAGFYKRAFAADNRENKKWKGVLRLWLPKDDGSDLDELTKRTLKGMVTAFEKSNPGYKWNWNEQSLAGRMVGILFRNEEWEYEGKTGWTVRPFRAISVDTVRSGDYTLPKDKPLKKKESSGYGEAYDGFASASNYSSSDFAMLDDDDSQFPF